MKKIAILILNYNGLEDTLVCLEDLSKIKIADFSYQIFLVDYGVENQVQELKSKYPHIKIYRNEKNLGFAGGNNFLIKKALAWQADYFLLLNNDTQVPSDFLLKLFNYLKVHPQIGAISPKIYFAQGYEYHKNRYQEKDLGKIIWFAGGKIDWQNTYCSHLGVDQVDQGQFDHSDKTDFISGCCCLIRSEVFNKVGFFDEKYFLYWEDVDLSLRIKKAGFDIKFLPATFIYHKNAGSSSVGSDLQDYFLNRNRLYFAFKYAGLRTRFAILRESLKNLQSGNFWYKQAIKDFYSAKMGIGSWKN